MKYLRIRCQKDRERNGLSFFKKNKHWILILGFVSCRPALTDEESKTVHLIQYHQKLRPEFEIQDAYKLLYQGNLGVEHIMGDTVAARQHLEYEMSSIRETEFPEEPLIENVSTDTTIVRVNLRPFKRLGMNTEKLWQAMVVSALHYPRVDKKFLRAWSLFVKLCEQGALSFDVEKVRIFDEQMNSSGYGASHHSNNYTEACKPAYRIVLLNEFEKIFQLSYH